MMSSCVIVVRTLKAQGSHLHDRFYDTEVNAVKLLCPPRVGDFVPCYNVERLLVHLWNAVLNEVLTKCLCIHFLHGWF